MHLFNHIQPSEETHRRPEQGNGQVNRENLSIVTIPFQKGPYIDIASCPS